MIARAASDVRQIGYDLKEYCRTNGRLPSDVTTGAVSVWSALFSNRMDVFSAPMPLQWTNSAGELIDPWKLPYRIEPAGTTNFVMRSAGPDGKFGNQDDVVFDSVRNAVVKP